MNIIARSCIFITTYGNVQNKFLIVNHIIRQTKAMMQWIFNFDLMEIQWTNVTLKIMNYS